MIRIKVAVAIPPQVGLVAVRLVMLTIAILVTAVIQITTARVLNMKTSRTESI